MPQLLITATYGHDHSTRAATVQKIDARRYPQLLMEYGTLGIVLNTPTWRTTVPLAAGRRALGS